MTQPNRGEVQLYHSVFAKYVTAERLFFAEDKEEVLTSTMVYGMVRSVLVKYYNVIYIGVSEVQPMVTRTLLSNYPVTLGDRQSPPLISSGLQSFEKDTGKTV